ncbi:MAG: nitrite reductase small subunit NirD [Bryobacterales bacterium]|nr:nitrite reductase small subunit NirD [Bryobacterales bacterium]
MQWIKITKVDNIPPREGRAVQVGQREIAIFHMPDGIKAIDNRCPHNQGPLCDGITSGGSVVCPLHGWKVCLDSGRVTRPDLPIRVRTYPVKVEDVVIQIQLSEERTEMVA